MTKNKANKLKKILKRLKIKEKNLCFLMLSGSIKKNSDSDYGDEATKLPSSFSPAPAPAWKSIRKRKFTRLDNSIEFNYALKLKLPVIKYNFFIPLYKKGQILLLPSQIIIFLSL